MNKKLKIIIPSVIVLIAIIIAVAIPVSSDIRLKSAEKNLFSQPFDMPEKYLVTAENGVYGQKENSLLYVKTAFDNGANCAEVDIVFSEDGTPYICDEAGEITERDAMPLEYLLHLIDTTSDYDGCSLNLHLKDAGNLSMIDKLADKYNMTERIFYTGVEINQAQYISSQSKIGFYLDYELDRKKSDDTDYIQQVYLDIINCSAVGINCDVDGFSENLGNVLKENWLKISFKDVDEKLEMYKALSFSPDQIITPTPQETRELADEWNINAPNEFNALTNE